MLAQRPTRSKKRRITPSTPTGRNFYKVEKWSRDGLRVELMLYAGNNLDKARRIFDRTTKHRPRIRLTIRQRMRVLDEWPRDQTILDAPAPRTRVGELYPPRHTRQDFLTAA